MIYFAEIGAWIGVVLLLVCLVVSIAALVALPFKKLMSVSGRQANALSESSSSASSDCSAGLSFLAWTIYGYLTLTAFLGEMWTLFSNAGFGYVYITLGMPTFLTAWLGLLIRASNRPVPVSWLYGAVGAALIITFGYANIN